MNADCFRRPFRGERFRRTPRNACFGIDRPAHFRVEIGLLRTVVICVEQDSECSAPGDGVWVKGFIQYGRDVRWHGSVAKCSSLHP